MVILGGGGVLGGERRKQTDAAGRFGFSELLPGTYSISAEAPGLQRAVYRDIELPVETTWTIDFTLDLQRQVQHVEVVAEIPRVDVTTSGSATYSIAICSRTCLPVDRSRRS